MVLRFDFGIWNLKREVVTPLGMGDYPTVITRCANDRTRDIVWSSGDRPRSSQCVSPRLSKQRSPTHGWTPLTGAQAGAARRHVKDGIAGRTHMHVQLYDLSTHEDMFVT